MELLTITEVAKTLKLSRAMVYKLMNSGELKSVHVGARRLIRSRDLAEFVDNLRESL